MVSKCHIQSFARHSHKAHAANFASLADTLCFLSASSLQWLEKWWESQSPPTLWNHFQYTSIINNESLVRSLAFRTFASPGFISAFVKCRDITWPRLRKEFTTIGLFCGLAASPGWLFVFTCPTFAWLASQGMHSDEAESHKGFCNFYPVAV